MVTETGTSDSPTSLRSGEGWITPETLAQFKSLVESGDTAESAATTLNWNPRGFKTQLARLGVTIDRVVTIPVGLQTPTTPQGTTSK